MTIGRYAVWLVCALRLCLAVTTSISHLRLLCDKNQGCMEKDISWKQLKSHARFGEGSRAAALLMLSHRPMVGFRSFRHRTPSRNKLIEQQRRYSFLSMEAKYSKRLPERPLLDWWNDFRGAGENWENKSRIDPKWGIVNPSLVDGSIFKQNKVETMTKEQQEILILGAQTLKRWQDVRNKLRAEFKSQPSMREWAIACGYNYTHIFARKVKQYKKDKTDSMMLHSGLVYSIAGKFPKDWDITGITYEDRVQTGMLALGRAIETFDVTKGNKFSTFAYPTIRGYILKSKDEGGVIRMPSSRRQELRNLRKQAGILNRALGRKPTLLEIAESMGIPEAKVKRVFAFEDLNRPFSLEADEGALYNVLRSRFLTPQEVALVKDVDERTSQILENLPPVEQTVLKMRTGLEDGTPKTFNAIAQNLSMTYSVVRRNYQDASDKVTIQSMREGLFDGSPKSFDEIMEKTGMTQRRLRKLGVLEKSILKRSTEIPQTVQSQRSRNFTTEISLNMDESARMPR